MRMINADDLEQALTEVGLVEVTVPIVDAEPVKHGHWLFYEEPDGYYHSECSECGQWCDEDVFLKGKWHYCPNCGAMMDKDERQEPNIVANVGTGGRLIDGAALKKQGWQLHRTVHGTNSLTYETKDIEDIPTVPFIDISALPIIDNYEIVRCKDCIHWYRECGENKCLELADIPLEPNDFCSHGKRREDEAD